jgi:hypothetical protein
MKTLTTHKVNGLNEALTIEVLDEPGEGNACHEYVIKYVTTHSPGEQHIGFQNGPIKEKGVNGISNEALLAIVIDRLEGFQSGQFSCQSNADALQRLEGALNILHSRTKERLARGVEGTNQK